jgi:phosphoribosylglycinamide formyltransferase-1
MKTIPSIVIFASGSGSNAEQIVRYFNEKKTARVSAVFCNNPKAGVIDRMRSLFVPVFLFNKEELYHSNTVLEALQKLQPNAIVLAGFLWLFPDNILQKFPNSVVNIHPSLLPKFGGKGMYGARVHQAVIEAKESTSGITIHLVNEVYDKGEILFQASVSLTQDETADSLAQKIHQLEYQHFPSVIENFVLSLA